MDNRFRYWELESWLGYFNMVQEVALRVQAIIDGERALKEIYHGRALDPDDKLALGAVLAGLSSTGQPLERGFSGVCHSLWGIGSGQIADFLATRELGLHKDLVLEVVPDHVDFLRGLTNIHRSAQRVLLLARQQGFLPDEVPPTASVDTAALLEPNSLGQLLTSLVASLCSILPNESPNALWLWTMDCITQRYMLHVYPKLAEPVPIRNTTLMPEPFFKLKVQGIAASDQAILDGYTVFRYQEGDRSSPGKSVGAALIRLYVEIWNAFEFTWNRCLSLVFTTPPMPAREFAEAATRSLNEIGWSMPKVGFERGSDTRSYTFQGVAFTGCRWSYVSTRGNYNAGGWGIHDWPSYEPRWTLPELLDALSPGLFLLNGLDFVNQGISLCLPNTENPEGSPAAGTRGCPGQLSIRHG